MASIMLETVFFAFVIDVVIAVLMLFHMEVAVLLMELKADETVDFTPFTTEVTELLMLFHMEVMVDLIPFITLVTVDLILFHTELIVDLIPFTMEVTVLLMAFQPVDPPYQALHLPAAQGERGHV